MKLAHLMSQLTQDLMTWSRMGSFASYEVLNQLGHQ